MELLQLKYFCDAAQSQNFSKTAQKFGVPPSCVSQSIKRLEKELSVKLFTRSANKILLNNKGIEFYEKVSEGLNIINNAATAVTDDGKNGEIVICVNSNRRIVMQTVKKFKSIYPDVNITTLHPTDIYSDQFDLIIDGENDALKSYTKHKLVTENLLAAINKNNPVLKKSNFSINMLADQPFISTNKQSPLYRLTNSVCKKYGFEPNIAVLSDDPFYVRKYVELNLAVTIAPEFSWYKQFDDSVVFFPIEGFTRTTYIYTNPNKYISICTKNFIKFLINECTEEYNLLEKQK
ncbi:MAG: LysR family transcriptional regulator [Clostridia bacterium]|nr:LysR family transcriptional regulator [Oscillospiraceae bacterium]MBQ6702425.1 LysR family transcriptional regulator [Clostridia bacterium]